MLKQVLDELRQVQGPVNLDDVSRKLGVERSALDEMIAFWVRKGKLVNTTLLSSGAGCAHCAISSCAVQECHSTNRMPRTFVVRR
jgi:hypothetical protein